MAEISKLQYEASLHGKTCVACDRRRPWWGLLTFTDCDRCGAHHCRHHKSVTKTGGAWSGYTITWTCRYCGNAHTRRVYPPSGTP